MIILTKREKEEIISRSNYWDEVAKRDHPSVILTDELISVVRFLGTKILWILEAYVKKEEK